MPSQINQHGNGFRQVGETPGQEPITPTRLFQPAKGVVEVATDYVPPQPKRRTKSKAQRRAE